PLRVAASLDHNFRLRPSPASFGPVAWLCEALDVSRSGFGAWLNRSPSARSTMSSRRPSAALYSSPRRPSSSMGILSSAEQYLRAARQMSGRTGAVHP
ncbi:MAG: hypothetical protein ABJH80_06630, partial [Nitratireductor sp.]